MLFECTTGYEVAQTTAQPDRTGDVHVAKSGHLRSPAGLVPVTDEDAIHLRLVQRIHERRIVCGHEHVQFSVPCRLGECPDQELGAARMEAVVELLNDDARGLREPSPAQ